MLRGGGRYRLDYPDIAFNLPIEEHAALIINLIRIRIDYLDQDVKKSRPLSHYTNFEIALVRDNRVADSIVCLTWDVDAGGDLAGLHQFVRLTDIDQDLLGVIGQVLDLLVGGNLNHGWRRTLGGEGTYGTTTECCKQYKYNDDGASTFIFSAAQSKAGFVCGRSRLGVHISV